MSNPKRPIIVGHKANTLRKIKKYLEMGIPVVEVDVIEYSNNIILQHVREKVPAEFNDQSYYSFHPFKRFLLHIGTPRYLKLFDVLKIINGKSGVLIDLKSKGIVDKVVDIIKDVDFKGTIYISSKYHRDVRRFKKLMPDVKGLLTLEEQPINLAEYIKRANADGISIKVAFVDESLINEVHKYGYMIATWTVNDIELARYLLHLGVDMVVTDIPDILMKELNYIDANREKSEEEKESIFVDDIDYMLGYEM